MGAISLPKRHHIDKRAAQAADNIAATGADEDWLSTKQLAKQLGTSDLWLELGRAKGYGPPFVKLSPRMVRYNKAAVIAWLREREVRFEAAAA
jgi:predicted DNA-binding transcriptional regulator AlpA